MSVIKEFQSFVIGNLQADAETKSSLNDIFDAINNDLDEYEYVPSSDVDEAVESFNKALIAANTEDDSVDEDDVDFGDEEETEDAEVISIEEDNDSDTDDSEDDSEEPAVEDIDTDAGEDDEDDSTNEEDTLTEDPEDSDDEET